MRLGVRLFSTVVSLRSVPPTVSERHLTPKRRSCTHSHHFEPVPCTSFSTRQVLIAVREENAYGKSEREGRGRRALPPTSKVRARALANEVPSSAVSHEAMQTATRVAPNAPVARLKKAEP